MSNDEYEPKSFDDYNENTIIVVDDEHYDMFLLGKAKENEDLMDNGFESFVKMEGPNQIMHLILKKQADNM